MKRSMIAVCLLLLWPGPAIACYDDHKASAGWIDEQPGRWSGYGIVAQAGQSGRLMGLSLFAGGSGVMILLGLIGRAWLHPAQAPLTLLSTPTRASRLWYGLKNPSASRAAIGRILVSC